MATAALPSWVAGPTLKIRQYLQVSLLSTPSMWHADGGPRPRFSDVDDSACMANETSPFQAVLNHRKAVARQYD